jgi:hypothetical protein
MPVVRSSAWIDHRCIALASFTVFIYYDPTLLERRTYEELVERSIVVLVYPSSGPVGTCGN